MPGGAYGRWVMAAAPPRAGRAPRAALGEHYPQILRYVRSVVRDAADAEDLAQETFVRAYRRRDSLRDPEATLAWLYSIATHVCLDRLRQEARRAPRRSTADPAELTARESVATAQLHVEQEEMSACVQGYVADLSDGYRAVLLLHDVYGLTSREIAALLGDSVGSVKIRLHRARGKLRQALEGGCSFSQDDRGTLVCDPSPPGVSRDSHRSSHQ